MEGGMDRMEGGIGWREGEDGRRERMGGGRGWREGGREGGRGTEGEGPGEVGRRTKWYWSIIVLPGSQKLPDNDM